MDSVYIYIYICDKRLDWSRWQTNIYIIVYLTHTVQTAGVVQYTNTNYSMTTLMFFGKRSAL